MKSISTGLLLALLSLSACGSDGKGYEGVRGGSVMTGKRYTNHLRELINYDTNRLSNVDSVDTDGEYFMEVDVDRHRRVKSRGKKSKSTSKGKKSKSSKGKKSKSTSKGKKSNSSKTKKSKSSKTKKSKPKKKKPKKRSKSSKTSSSSSSSGSIDEAQADEYQTEYRTPHKFSTENLLPDDIPYEHDLPTEGLLTKDNEQDMEPEYQPQQQEHMISYDLVSLEVINGSGDGAYPGGTRVEINADDCPDGEDFTKWTVEVGNSSILDPTARVTVMTTSDDGASVVRAECHKKSTEVVVNPPTPCDTMSDKERVKNIMGLLKEVTESKDFKINSNPQYNAMNWLINDDVDKVCPGENDQKLVQRYIAAVFYFTTDGDRWDECHKNDGTCGAFENDFEGGKPFLSPGDECDWAGLVCNNDGLIESIVFEEENNVAGYLAEEIGYLEALKVISLESQRIGGTLPKSIGNLANLKVLDLDYNEIGGNIHKSVYKLWNLEQLDLNNNQFTGTLSEAIGGMSKLTFLQLHNNKFTGSVPKDLIFCPLNVAEFKNNNFSGEMPLCIGAPWQTVKAITCDCTTGSVTCGDDCQCSCF